MDMDYKPNSHKAKASENSLAEKKVEKVISGTAKVRKKTGARKVADAFISEDAANVKSYIVMDVIIPAIKDILANVVKDSIDMILFGGTNHRRNSSGRKTNAEYVAYNRFSDRRDDRRYESRSTIASRYNFDDIILESKAEADEVLERMEEVLDTYGMVSVADLCDLIGISCEHTDNKYGWTSLRNARVVRLRSNEYVLELPRVTSLK